MSIRASKKTKCQWVKWVVLTLIQVLLLSSAVFAESDAHGRLKVIYMDVGQADAILIQLPDQRHVLIDGGNREDGPTVESYLQAESVKKIDFLVATHPHEDHIGGLPEVIDHFDVGQVVMPKVSANTKIFEKLLNSIKAKNLRITPAKAGAYLVYTNDLKLQVLAPASANYEETNDYSVVLKLTYKSKSFLFTGDAEAPSENEMVATKYDLKSDVLKVGHHGGRTSTSQNFLDLVKPEWAIIMVGKDNDYGHPHAETLQRLKGVKVLRTDLNGTVKFSTDGLQMTVSTDRKSEGQSVKTAVQASEKAQIFVTRTGKSYHVTGCSGLSKSKIAITLTEAKKKGYKPCNICHPPQ